MTALTHEQARYRLHIGRESFDDAAQSELTQHLTACAECRTYVAELATLQANLSRVMREHWDRHRPPVASLTRVQARIGRKTAQRQVLNLGGSLVTISILIILAGLLIWMIGVTGPGDVNRSGPSAAGGATVSAVPNSTVPIVITSTPIPGLAVFGENITLGDVAVAETHFMAGSTISLTLRWQTQAVMTTSYTVFVHLLDGEGNLVAQSDSIPGDGAYPTTTWLPGETVADNHQLVLPDNLATGRYDLAIGLHDPDNGERLITRDGESAVRLATIDVQGISHRMGEDFGEFATLLGFDLANDRLAPGDAVEMTLYWRARAQTTASYIVSVQVFGENKTIVAQADTVPGGGAFPMTNWQPGEIIVDSYTIRLPADLPAGQYPIVLTMYDSTSGAQVFTGTGNGAIVLATLDIVPPPAPSATPVSTNTLLPASPTPALSTAIPAATRENPSSVPPTPPPATWTPFPTATPAPPSTATPTPETAGPTPAITFTPPPTPADSPTPFPTFTPTP